MGPKARGRGGRIGEAYTQHCDTVPKPNGTKKQFFGAFWCFVEQTNPKQNTRQNTLLVLFGALGYRKNSSNNEKAQKAQKARAGD